MGNNALGAGLSTRRLLEELSARVGEDVTRNMLTRLRAQYAGRIPEPVAFGTALAWPATAIDALVQILGEEARCRGGLENFTYPPTPML